jgi:hypothetical protein
MRCFIIALALAGFATTAFGQESRSLFEDEQYRRHLHNPGYPIALPGAFSPAPSLPVRQFPPEIAALEYRAFAPPSSALPPTPPAAPVGSRSARIEHLTQAVSHLEAAGLKEDAEKIRQKLDAEKTAAAGDIKALQAEIERLRALIGKPAPQVLLHVRVLEISWKDLAAAGYKLPDDLKSSVDVIFQQDKKAENSSFKSPVSRGPCIIDSNDRLCATLNSLEKQNVVRILAEPTMVAVSGQHSRFSVGGDFPVPSRQSTGETTTEWKRYGTQVDWVSVMLADNKIRLDCHMEISHLDMNRQVTIAGVKVPGVRSREVRTTTELRSGQTLVVAGLVQSRTVAGSGTSGDSAADKTSGKNEKYETLFLLTPEILEPPLK